MVCLEPPTTTEAGLNNSVFLGSISIPLTESPSSLRWNKKVTTDVAGDESIMELASAVPLVLLVLSRSARGGLRCSACSKSHYVGASHITHDGLRTSMHLGSNRCLQLDELECDRDKNACLTESRYVNAEEGWWLTMGCTFVNPAPYAGRGLTYQDYDEASYYSRSSPASSEYSRSGAGLLSHDAAGGGGVRRGGRSPAGRTLYRDCRETRSPMARSTRTGDEYMEGTSYSCVCLTDLCNDRPRLAPSRALFALFLPVLLSIYAMCV